MAETIFKDQISPGLERQLFPLHTVDKFIDLSEFGFLTGKMGITGASCS